MVRALDMMIMGPAVAYGWCVPGHDEIGLSKTRWVNEISYPVHKTISNCWISSPINLRPSDSSGLRFFPPCFDDHIQCDLPPMCSSFPDSCSSLHEDTFTSSATLVLSVIFCENFWWWCSTWCNLGGNVSSIKDVLFPLYVSGSHFRIM